MDNSKKLLDRIKTEEIHPTPKWVFSTTNFLIWSGFLLFVLFGAIAFSVILFAVQQTDFNIISHISHSKLELLLGLLPMIWLVLVLVFLGLAILSIRNSKKGYKFSVFKLVTISVMISMALGTLFFIAGGSSRLEQVFSVTIPGYESIEERKIQIWNNPKEGYLSGTINTVDEAVIVIKDFNGKRWEINHRDAFIAPILMLESGEKIKIVGHQEGANTFDADEIRPWGGKKGKGFGPGGGYGKGKMEGR